MSVGGPASLPPCQAPAITITKKFKLMDTQFNCFDLTVNRVIFVRKVSLHSWLKGYNGKNAALNFPANVRVAPATHIHSFFLRINFIRRIRLKIGEF